MDVGRAGTVNGACAYSCCCSRSPGWFVRPSPTQGSLDQTLTGASGRAGSSCWSYYEGGDYWTERCVDKVYGFPRADVVGAGRRLHIRLNKPQRPESFKIIAYPRLDEYGEPDYGVSKKLTRTFGRVERDGKTVAWNVFFRVNEPNRHYYLKASGNWKGVPDTHISYGEGMWFFHVKTR